ncbi:class I SAM-dependent methyltransferase [Allonocardiopsis opalescens]|uniref:Methyltransferase family protein n=1 Tax=Allonocardiopsis opalescens TaxID=1144618 RepID=A0A2T0QER2_9ACTN|nr:class I SAM-dependent methyltransferase [Allonocardiopsis opalescens]PRY02434.1 methyltransferase family protein [Allonocardiopsis opalescens]
MTVGTDRAATGTAGRAEDGVVERVRRYWDWRAASFRADIAATPDREAWRRAYAEAAAALLPGRAAPLRVLDVGSGTGFVALLFAELGHEVTAVEPAAAMREIAAKEAAERGTGLRLLDGVAHPLPELDGGFDLVTCRNVLWTLPDPAAALAHWRGVLRPGGAVLVSDGMWNTWRHELRLLREGLRSRGGEAVGPRFLAAYLGIRRRLPYYRGLDAARARRVLAQAGYPSPVVLDHLLPADSYQAGTGDGYCLVGARTAADRAAAPHES